ncbi:MAG: hypothetical protein CMC19_07035 [Flavobacteriaceae bacterium]|nr:hypothetical protein [Flavobacteriaceae bacterium]OUX39659.1 MAG: hypothetical protein CBE25_03555 [Flavobacteriaceae bacterium TMED265]
MTLKSILAIPFAKYTYKKEKKWIDSPLKAQQKTLSYLIKQGRSTAFGKDHDFNQINDYQTFKCRVPVRDYEQLKSYVHRIIEGEKNVLWPGQPAYLAKTSGTTSGAKYIPITAESMSEQVRASKNALLFYIAQTKNANYVNGKMIFLQGSPVLTKKGNINVGRLSGISAHYLPSYLLKNRLPTWETNCIEEWEDKVDAIVEETSKENMTLIAGIPSWVQMYFEKLNTTTGKKVGDLFPNFSLFVYGGVNYEPYRKKFESLIGRKVDSIELFPASEGFFAFQDDQNDHGLLLQLNSGIYYEFIPIEHYFDENPRRLNIEEVELGKDYALILSTTAGLWGYDIGDTVRFTSLEPYKIIVSGRVKHFISAFGEHVIAKEVEQAMKEAIEQTDARVNEFSVAPQINPKEGLPFHEWFVEFDHAPKDISFFAAIIDDSMQRQNIYYKDLLEGNILRPAEISCVAKGGFEAYMSSEGKLGGQNKVKRLSNDRVMANKLSRFLK